MSGGVPLSMEEWNYRLRNQKQQDRQKKNETAQILRGYRGGINEEELKLRTLREEERKRQKSAETLLHNYRNTGEADELAVKPQRRTRQQGTTNHPHPPVTVREDVDPLASITPGSVSEKAGVFSINDTQPGFVLDGTGMGGPSGSANDATSGVGGVGVDDGRFPISGEEVVVDNTASVLPAQAGDNAFQQQPQPFLTDRNTAMTESNGDALATTTSTTSSGSCVEEPASQGTSATAVSNSSPAPNVTGGVIETMSDGVNGHSLPEGGVPPSVTTTTNNYPSNVETSYMEEKKSETSPVSEARSKTTTTTTTRSRGIVRTDVLFSFGLITSSMDPGFEAYMLAVEEILKDHLDSTPRLAEKIRYNPDHRPHVKGFHWDDGFKDTAGRDFVRRMMVTASAPIFVQTDAIDLDVARNGVIRALEQSILSGSFLNLAQQKTSTSSAATTGALQ